jgi:hypothetical protein
VGLEAKSRWSSSTRCCRPAPWDEVSLSCMRALSLTPLKSMRHGCRNLRKPHIGEDEEPGDAVRWSPHSLPGTTSHSTSQLIARLFLASHTPFASHALKTE